MNCFRGFPETSRGVDRPGMFALCLYAAALFAWRFCEVVGRHEPATAENYSIIEQFSKDAMLELPAAGIVQVRDRDSHLNPGRNQQWNDAGDIPRTSDALPRRSLASSLDQSDRTCSDPRPESELPAAIATVTSSEGLWAALDTWGVQIIEVRRHLDLTHHLGRLTYIPRTRPYGNVRMIRGNCTDAPSVQLAKLDTVLNIPLRDINPGQCLVFVNTGFIDLSATDMWLDNLYFRLHKTSPDPTTSSMEPLVDAGSAGLWMTNVAMQGDGDATRDCRDCGIFLAGSLAYIEDGLFADFFSTSIAVASNASRILMKDTTFLNNTLSQHEDEKDTLRSEATDPVAGGSILTLAGLCNPDSFPGTDDTLVALQNCVFSNNDGFASIVAQTTSSVSTSVWSDNTDEIVLSYSYPKFCTDPARMSDLTPVSSLGAANSTTLRKFLDMDTKWLKETQELLTPDTRMVCIEDWAYEHPEKDEILVPVITEQEPLWPLTYEPEQTETSSDWHSQTVVIILLACAGTVMLVLTGIIIYMYRRMNALSKRFQGQDGYVAMESFHDAEPPPHDPSSHEQAIHDPSSHNSSSHNSSGHDSSSNNPSSHNPSSHNPSGHNPSSHDQSCYDMSPSEAASNVYSRETVLDSRSSHQRALLEASEADEGLIWAQQPLHGGVVDGEGTQGFPTRHTPHSFQPTSDGLMRREAMRLKKDQIVVGAVIEMPNGRRCTVKSIDLNRSTHKTLQCIVSGSVPDDYVPHEWIVTFDLTSLRVKGMAAREALKGPLLHRFFDEPKFYTQDRGILVTDPSGAIYPPFVMVPKRETLHERCPVTMDRGTAVEVASHISALLAILHRMGIAHRDITFDNIINVDGKWKLAWSPHTAWVGATQRIPYESQFRSPQQLKRLQQGKIIETVHWSVDLWALGLVFFELLTMRRAFHGICDRKADQIFRILVDGDAKLPWESPMSEHVEWHLKGFEKIFYGSLKRGRRIKAEKFYELLNSRWNRADRVTDIRPDTPRDVARNALTSREEAVRAPTSANAMVCAHQPRRAATSTKAMAQARQPRSGGTSMHYSLMSVSTTSATTNTSTQPTSAQVRTGRIHRESAGAANTTTPADIESPDERQVSGIGEEPNYEGHANEAYSEESDDDARGAQPNAERYDGEEESSSDEANHDEGAANAEGVHTYEGEYSDEGEYFEEGRDVHEHAHPDEQGHPDVAPRHEAWNSDRGHASSIVDAPDTPSALLEGVQNSIRSHSSRSQCSSRSDSSRRRQPYRDTFVIASSDRVFTKNEATGEVVFHLGHPS